MRKMFRSFFYIILFFSFNAFSQNLVIKYRFVKEDLPIKDYFLNIKNDKSLFYDSEYCSKLGTISELIILKDKSADVTLLDKLGDVSISTNKKIPLNWEIKSEKKIIEEYVCQRAEVVYKGQKWIVWFTNDLPFQDGPFIFKGLPGLILMAENDEYKFELLEIIKSSKFCSIITDDRKEIDYEKYESFFNDISSKNNALLNSLGNLNLNLETDLSSASEKEKTLNTIRELL